MEKKRIVLVEKDENYLSTLELMLISREENSIELELITDEGYLLDFLSESQKIDCLVIDENMMVNMLERHSIRHIFILSENAGSGFQTVMSGSHQDTDWYSSNSFQSASNIEIVDKYCGVRELFHKIIGSMGLSADDRVVANDSVNSSSKIIMITSQFGGVGKTRVALSLALRLSELKRRVLYMSLDQIQRNHVCAGINDVIPDGMEQLLINQDDELLTMFDQMIFKGDFDYFLPWTVSRDALGLKAENYRFLIETLKKSRQYEYIILDDNSSFDEFSREMMDVSDNIVNVIDDTEIAKITFKKFETEIKKRDKEKVFCVLNRSRGNILSANEIEVSEIISEYRFYNSNWLVDLKQLSIMKDIALMLV